MNEEAISPTSSLLLLCILEVKSPSLLESSFNLSDISARLDIFFTNTIKVNIINPISIIINPIVILNSILDFFLSACTSDSFLEFIFF